MPEKNEAITIIGEAIKDCGSSCLIYRKKRQRFDVESHQQIFYLIQGSVNVYRKSDDVLTNTVTGPAILGLLQMKMKEKTHYFRCDTDCEMWSLSIHDTNAIFNEKDLWGYAFDLLTHSIYQWYRRSNMIEQKDVYSIVVQHLKYIWEMSTESRTQTSIYSFILRRSHISRSSIHKAICVLKEEGVVKVNRGKLLELSIK
ncbi:helix-turn-helix domain-containing protein [Yokenella regensburgei]|uniref:DNA-binding transcriptional regulator n=1 Tax=Yokenella regensburgei TaxID=158877 RepID=A0AB38FZX7_9ENTR|nr:helix-turn-helix domain-containing protein [Yokenella regensburgei]KFD23656.1 hypothetical protein GYRE_01987 [Yokenella regensburgei ATCC 49455]MDQ4428979.1 helix-turn-helix domain-containing protein [Yokenella regensburgei]SQA63687.1 putative DNA-binding transcriptional regulator [Yokenella regensburgei]SQA65797.1 putative DNA-binding transcriptional regulator [Yokenella regensburgei]SUQ04416.1 putative DNA-binding transcriptional regulator [Yokenella regensburgei]